MTIRLSLILIGSILALPQNFNVINDYSNKVDNVDTSLYRRAFTNVQGQDTFPGLSGLEAGKQYILDEYGYEEGTDYKVTNSYSSDNGLTHIYLKQLNNGLEVDNGNMNLNVDSNGKILSVGGSFNKSISSSNDDDDSNTQYWDSPVNALFSLFEYLEVDPEVDQNEVDVRDGDDKDTFTLSNVKSANGDITATKKYIQDENGQFVEVWTFEVDLGEHYWNAAVTPEGEIIELNDLIDNFSY